MRNIYFYDTRLGRIGIADNGMSGGEDAITHLCFQGSPVPEGYCEKETPVIKEAGRQLAEYLEGKRTHFDLSYEMEGTDFEKKVWNALLTIPYGETRSYGDIAAQVGNKKACRAVGRANGRNPIGIFVPCHRVIGANGKLTGFAGGISTKEALLEIEQVEE